MSEQDVHLEEAACRVTYGDRFIRFYGESDFKMLRKCKQSMKKGCLYLDIEGVQTPVYRSDMAGEVESTIDGGKLKDYLELAWFAVLIKNDGGQELCVIDSATDG